MVSLPDKNIDPDNLARIIMLVFGPMEDGGEYWCYVAVKPGRYEQFKRVMATKQYNIQNFAADGYGEVLVSGDGGLPPEEITREVARRFGIPVRQLFDDIDPQAAIAKRIAEMQNANNASS